MENKVNWRLGKILDDRYEIQSVLGIGGMAVVYKAFDRQTRRDVALKVLRDDAAMDAESRKRFRTEYQAVEQLSHPNIRAVYDVVESGDTEYIVMEYVDGINLKQYLKKKGALPWQEVLHFSSQITRALSHAHSRGIIHMDIKPQNIMLPKDGTVKIADFGIAQMDEAPTDDDAQDEAVGSIHYISPEQARGEAVDARSDIYSLGVVMYEMLTGRLPFTGETVEQVAVQHYSVIPEAPGEIDPSIPQELEEITLCAMQPDPDDRYPTAADMLADLEDFKRSRSVVPTATATATAAVDAPAAKTMPVRIVKDEVHVITRNVPRISKSGELSREGYNRRRSRANSISMLLGFFLVAAFALGLFAFVWQYWLRDIFSDAERVDVPAFVGRKIEDIINNKEMLELYNFNVSYQPDATHREGVIMEQDPAAGASRMIVSNGIDVTLTVSSGIQMITMPEDLVNVPYTEAQVRLQAMGLNVIIAQEKSGDITENYVISTDPAPGESVVSGSTVTLIVSAGPTVTYTNIPNVVGQTKETALLSLQREGLICGESEITYVSSTAAQQGIVMWANYTAGTQVVTGTRVYLQIGMGPTASAASDQATYEQAAPPA